MRNLFKVKTIAPAVPFLLCAAPVFAQEAQPSSTVELPEVVVTAPSPVVKPATGQAGAPATGSDAGVNVTSDSTADIPPGILLVADDAFAPVTIVTKDEVLSTQGHSITDVLENKPGITTTSFAPGASRPIIRGLDSYRVRVQENGIGAHDFSTISEDHAVPIDPHSVDKMEVVRGPATLRYGSGAIGGVVAVENQRIPTAVPKNGITGEVKGGLTSVDDGRDGGFSVTAGGAGFAIHGDAFGRRSQDYETPNGDQRNSFVESSGFAIGASMIGTDGFLGVSFSGTDSIYGIPGEEADEGVDPKIDLSQRKLNVRGEMHPQAFGIEAIRLWYGLSDYRHVELAKHEGEDEFEVGSRFTNLEHEGRLEVQHQPVASGLGTLSGALGIQVTHRRQRGQSFEGESLLEPAETQSIAGYWFEELALPGPLSLQAAGRIEHNNVDGFGWTDVTDPDNPVEFDGDRTFIPISGSVGLLYQLGFDTTARLTGQYSERAPDSAELFSKGVHEATGTFEIGNPNLKKERAMSLEAGLARSNGPLRFDMAAYVTEYRGFIFRALQDVVCLEDLPSCGTAAAAMADENFDLVFFRQQDALFYGVDLSAQLDVAPIWNGVWGVDGRYDFVNAEFDGGENVPRIPPHRLGGGIFYRSADWFAHVGVLHAFEQDEIGANEEVTPGYTLVSAEVRYNQTLANGTKFTIGLKGENLADDEVLNHASFKRREEVLEPGASVRLFGSIKLN